MRPSPRHVSRPAASRSVFQALGVALSAVLLVSAPAAAVTYKVTMNDGFDFQPSTRTIGRGDTVKWKNNASFEDHDVKSTAPNGYFTSPGGQGGIDPGESYSKLFRNAGSYPYVCLEHSTEGMKGKVRVPMRVVRDGNTFRLTVGSGTAEAGYRRDIWIDRPGTSGWQHLAYTDSAVHTFTPTSSGTYKFKTRLQDDSGSFSGQTSKFSPVVSITN